MRGWCAAVVTAVAASAAGCAVQRPDVEGEAARLTGLQGAIVFNDGGTGVSVTQPMETLTMEQAVRLCLQHDPRIQGALARVRIAEAEAGQARLLPNPILTVDIRFPTEPGTGRTVEATLAGDVLSLLQKPGQIGAADKRLREAACDALTVVLDVMEEVEESYVAAAALDAQAASAREREELLAKVADIADKRQKAGDTGRLETVIVQAQLATAAGDEQDLRGQAHAERLHLGRLIGAGNGAVDWVLTPAGILDEQPGEEEAWVAAAMRNRPEVQSKVWELRALGDDLTAAEFVPLAGGDMGAHAEHDPTWRVGPAVSVPVPMFDWGQASRAKIKAQRAAAAADLQEIEAEVVQNMHGAYGVYAAAREGLARMEGKVLPLQREARDSAKRSYDAGDVEMSVLLLAENDLRVAESKEIDLRTKVAVSRGQLMRAAGETGIGAELMQPATRPLF